MAAIPYTPIPIFRLVLPLELAPTMNVYARMRVKKASSVKHGVGALVFENMPNWPDSHCGVRIEYGPPRVVRNKMKRSQSRHGGKRRMVVVTRYSSQEPDDPSSVDCVGGKTVLDRLVHHGVLVDDNMQWCKRVGRWVKVKRGEGRLVVEVFEWEHSST